MLDFFLFFGFVGTSRSLSSSLHSVETMAEERSSGLKSLVTFALPADEYRDELWRAGVLALLDAVNAFCRTEVASLEAPAAWSFVCSFMQLTRSLPPGCYPDILFERLHGKLVSVLGRVQLNYAAVYYGCVTRVRLLIVV